MGNFLRPQNPGNQGTKWEEPVHRLPCSNCAAPKPPTHVRAAINCTTRTTNKSSNTGEGSMAGNAISRLRRQISLKLAQRLCKISVRRNQVRRHIAIDRLAWENRLFARRAREHEFAPSKETGGPISSPKRFSRWWVFRFGLEIPGGAKSGPCLTVRAIGRSRNTVRIFGRYATARTIAVAVVAAIFAGGVIMPPLLEANRIVAHVESCVVLANLSSGFFKGNPPSLATDSTQRSVIVRRRIQLLEKASLQDSPFGDCFGADSIDTQRSSSI
jgi:hypothetical protein